MFLQLLLNAVVFVLSVALTVALTPVMQRAFAALSQWLSLRLFRHLRSRAHRSVTEDTDRASIAAAEPASEPPVQPLR